MTQLVMAETDLSCHKEAANYEHSLKQGPGQAHYASKHSNKEAATRPGPGPRPYFGPTRPGPRVLTRPDPARTKNRPDPTRPDPDKNWKVFGLARPGLARPNAA